MVLSDMAELRTDLMRLSDLAGGLWSEDELQIEMQEAPHDRPTLPSGRQAIYAFFLEDLCLYVGKAGPNSDSRFRYHHYGGASTESLAKFLSDDTERLRAHVQLQQIEFPKDPKPQIWSTGKWLLKHCGRMNIFLHAECGSHAGSLVEAFLHCRWTPIYGEV